MGADGHIKIYDFEILEAIVGKGNVPRTPIIYHQKIFGKKLVTSYSGDNIGSEDCVYCGEDFDDHEEDTYFTHQKLVKPAHITNWEVWT